MQYLLSFIYRDSKVFNVVSSCHAADVPSVSDFVPKPTKISTSLVRTASVTSAHSSSILSGRGGRKTLCLMDPHTGKTKGVKTGNQGGQAIFPPCPIQATTVRWRYEDFYAALHRWNAMWKFE
jgi:hypothetical protein